MILACASVLATHGGGSVPAGIILVVVILLVLFSMVIRFTRGQTLLETWASQNGFEIVSQEECWLFKGPFFWTTSKGQKVYKVSMRGRDGVVRTGYARCGGYWVGMLSDAVDVRWDDERLSSQ